MKLKKILASLTAAALAVTTMAFAPVSVSAEVTVDTQPLKTWESESGGGFDTVASEHYTISLGEIIDSPSEVNRVKFTFTDVTTDYLKICFVKDGGYDNNGSWVSDYNNGNYFEANISNDTGIIDVTFGVTTNADGNANSLTKYDAQDIKTNLTIYPNWMNAGSVSLKKIELYDSSDTLLKTVVGEPDVPKVTVTIWEGTPVATGNWANSVIIPKDTFAQFTAGGKITVTITDTLADAQYGTRYIDGSDWINILDYSSGMTAGTTSFSFAVSDELLETLQGHDLVIAGHDYTITKVEYICPQSAHIEPSIELNKSTLSLIAGDSETLIATVSPVGSTITWSSSDKTIATVDENGKVTAVAAGEATITAKLSDTVSAECEVTVISKKKITVTTNDDTYGTASADKTEAAAGETVKISAEAADGYQFDNWVVISGGVKLVDEESENTSFKMPAAEVEIKAVFSEIPENSYGITVKSAEGGSAKASEKSAVAGTKITLTATPDDGYEFDKWIVSPETVVIENDTFTMPEAAVTITPVFKKLTYTVEVDITAGGTASVDKTTAQMGDTVNITVKPNDGFVLDSITVNGTKISGTSFTMPAKDVLVSVSFKAEGSAEVEVEAPEGVSIGFAGDKEDVLAAIFGEDYAALIEAGYKLDVIMTVKDETAVSDEDKALIKAALADGQQVGLILDVTLIKTMNGVSEAITEAKRPVPFSISVPDSIIADGRTYSVMRVHDGKPENIGGDFDSETKTITVSSALFSTYAIVYEGKAAAETETVTKPEPVKYYTITTDKNVTASASTAAAGTVIDVKADFGYDAYVYCGTRMLMKITDRGSFVMPAGNVRIVSQENGYLSMVKNAAPNSYIFVYDADMNYIKTNGSVKGIVGKGKVTVKLGEEYAGRTVTLYKGRKSTKVEVASMVLDENGNATFTVDGGKNYTAVVE